MKNDVQLFTNNELGVNVRVIRLKGGEPYFVASDVAKALGYKVPKDAVRSHCRGAVKHRIGLNTGSVDGRGNKVTQMMEVNIIPESDVYRLIMRSNLPSAEKFQDWVCEEVLPSIRKHGGYLHTTYQDTPEEILARALLLADATIKEREKKIKALEEEVEYKEDIIVGLVQDIDLADKRQIINRVVRHEGANYQERWRVLYREFEGKYHMNLNLRFEKAKNDFKPKLRNKIDFIERGLDMIPELFEVAVKLFESDVRELAEEMYQLNKNSRKWERIEAERRENR